MSLFAFLGFVGCGEDKKDTEIPTYTEVNYTIFWGGEAPLTDVLINECDKDNKVKNKQGISYISAPTGYASETCSFTTTVPNITKIEVFSKSDGKYFYDSREVKNNQCNIFIGSTEITLEQYNEGISR